MEGVTLAADGQQQRMHSGGIDRMHAMHARQHGRNDRPGDLVNQLAERGVFLRRAADHGERPDRIVPAIHVLHAQHRKIVLQAVVAQVIAERPFGLDEPADRSCR